MLTIQFGRRFPVVTRNARIIVEAVVTAIAAVFASSVATAVTGSSIGSAVMGGAVGGLVGLLFLRSEKKRGSDQSHSVNVNVNHEP